MIKFYIISKKMCKVTKFFSHNSNNNLFFPSVNHASSLFISIEHKLPKNMWAMGLIGKSMEDTCFALDNYRRQL